MKKKIKELYKNTNYHKEFVTLVLIIIGTLIMEILTISYITKRILNIEIPNKNIQGLYFFTVCYIIIIFIQCYLVLKHCNMRSILKIKIRRDLKQKVFEKLQKVKLVFYDENETGTILQFLKDDVEHAANLFPKVMIEMYAMGLFRFTIIAIFLMFIDWQVTCMILFLYIIGFFIALAFNHKTLKYIEQIRKITSKIYSKIHEGVNGFVTIKTLEIMKKEIQNLEEILEQYTQTNVKLEKIISCYNSIFSFIVSLSIPIIIYFSGMKILQGIASYAEIMLFIEYSEQLQYEFGWFIKHVTDLKQSVYSYTKVMEFLQEDEIEKIEEGKETPPIETIEFQNISFDYNENQKIIQNFNLLIKKQEKIALVGKTGVGKSTITNLLCRFYEPNQGKILINGEDYTSFSIQSLRSRIGYIIQDVQILPGSIIDNIRYVNSNISLEEIEEIFKRLKLDEKILKLKDGYYTDLHENPDLLSSRGKTTNSFCKGIGNGC